MQNKRSLSVAHSEELDDAGHDKDEDEDVAESEDGNEDGNLIQCPHDDCTFEHGSEWGIKKHWMVCISQVQFFSSPQT